MSLAAYISPANMYIIRCERFYVVFFLVILLYIIKYIAHAHRSLGYVHMQKAKSHEKSTHERTTDTITNRKTSKEREQIIKKKTKKKKNTFMFMHTICESVHTTVPNHTITFI